jgi:uncharacterized membrane protein (DUF4010 family)
LARERAVPIDLLAAGTLAACSTMFPRMLVLVAPVSPALAASLAAPLIVAGLTGYAASGLFARRAADSVGHADPKISNPLDLKMALRFGALLVAILFAARALQVWLGDAALLGLAAVSGLADVDAITLSVASMSQPSMPQPSVPQEGLSRALAVAAVLVAATTNSLAKIGLAIGIGGMKFGGRVLLGLGAALAAGGLVAAIL